MTQAELLRTVIGMLPMPFGYRDLDPVLSILKWLWPANDNGRAKIRQVCGEMVHAGELRRIGPGRYVPTIRR